MRHIDISITEAGKVRMFRTTPAVASEVKRLLKRRLGSASENGDVVSAETAFPHLFDERGGGAALAGARLREGFTQAKLAEKLGILRHHLSEMEHGKRPIGKAMAKRLSTLLRADYRVFL